jgi:hypothetical protein
MRVILFLVRWGQRRVGHSDTSRTGRVTVTAGAGTAFRHRCDVDGLRDGVGDGGLTELAYSPVNLGARGVRTGRNASIIP